MWKTTEAIVCTIVLNFFRLFMRFDELGNARYTWLFHLLMGVVYAFTLWMLLWAVEVQLGP